MQPFLQHCWTHLLQHHVELWDTAIQQVMFGHLLYNVHMQVQRVHTHLIKHSSSSVVKQAASVPAELSLLVILSCVSNLDVPEVFWNVRLNLPATH